MNIIDANYKEALEYNSFQTDSLWIRIEDTSGMRTGEIISIRRLKKLDTSFLVYFSQSRNILLKHFLERFIIYKGNLLVKSNDKEWLSENQKVI